VVVVGAHLDSVIAGPGINDNGSGSSTILEIAEQMAKLGIKNRPQEPPAGPFVYDGDGFDTPRPARRDRRRSRKSSTSTSPARDGPSSRQHLTAVPTTARTSPSASPPAACSAAPRARRPPRRRPSTAAPPARLYDPCYHQACDTTSNLNTKALSSSATPPPTPP
jgi:hypothetical protein